jgi:hypothetical protein
MKNKLEAENTFVHLRFKSHINITISMIYYKIIDNFQSHPMHVFSRDESIFVN